MNGDDFDRLALALFRRRAEPRGIAVDADDPSHLPRRHDRGFTAAEFEKRRQPRKLQLDLRDFRSEEHTSELQSLMRNSYAVFCLKKKTHNTHMMSHDTHKVTVHTHMTVDHY